MTGYPTTSFIVTKPVNMYDISSSDKEFIVKKTMVPNWNLVYSIELNAAEAGWIYLRVIRVFIIFLNQFEKIFIFL